MPRYELKVRARFEAAHHLTSYRGAPEPVHGHSFLVEARVESPELGGEGYAVDFVALHGALDELAGRFRHRDLNTVPPFDRLSPTAEHLARWFHDELSAWLRAQDPGSVPPGTRISAVTLWEGPDSAATYLGDIS